MPGSRFGLEVISDITAKSQQLIILGTVHLVGIQTESRCSREVILTVAHPGKHHARKDKRSGDTQFIAVHQRRACLARLPFVRTVQLHIPAFTATEDIILRHRKSGTRSRLIIALHSDIKIQFRIVGFIERGNDLHIQCIRHKCRITRYILHLRITENTDACQTLLNTGLTVQTIQTLHRTLAGNTCAVLYLTFPPITLIVQPTVKHVGTYRWFVVVMYGQAFVIHAVIGFLPLLSKKIDGFTPHTKLLLGYLWHTGNGNQAHLDMPIGNHHGIGLIG